MAVGFSIIKITGYIPKTGDYATVYHDGRIVFQFRNGTEIETIMQKETDAPDSVWKCLILGLIVVNKNNQIFVF